MGHSLDSIYLGKMRHDIADSTTTLQVKLRLGFKLAKEKHPILLPHGWAMGSCSWLVWGTVDCCQCFVAIVWFGDFHHHQLVRGTVNRGCTLLKLTMEELSLSMADLKSCWPHTFIICCVLEASIAVLGIIGNIIAFFTFGKMEQQNATTFLFRALAVVDSWMLALTPVEILNYINPGPLSVQLPLHAYAFRYIRPLVYISQGATIWVAVLVGVYRYIAVCKPLMASRICTAKNAKISFIFVLVFFFLFMSPMFFEYEFHTIHLDSGENVTYATIMAWAKTFGYRIVYTCVLEASVLTIIPLALVTFCTVCLTWVLRTARKQRMELRMQHRTETKVTTMLVVVLMVFLVCQTQAMIKQVLYYTLPEEKKWCGTTYYYFSYISNVIVLLNSAINCIIYIVFNEQFRQIICSKNTNRRRCSTPNKCNSVTAVNLALMKKEPCWRIHVMHVRGWNLNWVNWVQRHTVESTTLTWFNWDKGMGKSLHLLSSLVHN